MLWFEFIGGLMVFTIFQWQHLPNWPLKSVFLIGLGMYLLIAFIFAGVAPRYASPYLVFMFPVFGYWMSKWRLPGRDRTALRNFFLLYYLAFGALGVAYVALTMMRGG